MADADQPIAAILLTRARAGQPFAVRRCELSRVAKLLFEIGAAARETHRPEDPDDVFEA